jgi:hypothetical protein
MKSRRRLNKEFISPFIATKRTSVANLAIWPHHYIVRRQVDAEREKEDV